MKPKYSFRNFLTLTGSIVLTISSAQAGQTWDGGGADDFWNTAGNWDGTAPGVLPNFGNAITFTGNTRNGAVNDRTAASTVGGINFTNDGSANKTNAFTLSGNSITLSNNITTTANTTGSTITDIISLDMILNGNRIITTNQLSNSVQHNLTVSGIISESGGVRTLTKAGAGLLTLTGANSYTGATIINAGTLDLGGGTANGSLASTILTLGGGSFSYTRSGTNTQTFTTTNLNAAPASVITVASGNTLNLGNLVRATGVTMDFSTTGAGTVATTTANVGGILAGFTHGDTWAVGNGANVDISGLADGSYTLSSVAGTTGANYTGNNIDVDNSAGPLDAGITANSLRFSAAGANTLSLTGANTVTTGGILVGSAVGANLSTITGGTLAGAASKDLSVIQNNAAGGLTIASDIVNNGGATAMTKSGAGLLTLAGNNTFTGGVLINDGGEVRLNNAGALNSTAGQENAVTFGAGSTATLTLGGNSVVVRSLNTNTASPGTAIVQNASASAATLTIGNSGNAASIFAGVIQDGTGGGALSLSKAGTQTLTLTGTNTYSGGTTVNAGTLAIISDANLGDSSGDLTFAGNSTLNMNALGFSMAAGRTITINEGVTATFTSNNSGKTFEGSLEGSGTLFVNHSTSFTFNNASSFTGSFRVATANNASYGLDMLTLRDEAGDGSITLENGSFRWFGTGGTKTFDDRQFFLGSSSGGSIYNRSTDNSALVITRDLGQSGSGTRTLTLGGNNDARGTFSGDIGDNGASAVSLTKTEGNVWALGGTNTYSGVTNLVASGTTGRLIFQGSQSLSANTTIAFNQNSSSVQSISLLDDATGTIDFARPITFVGANTTQLMNIFVGNNNTANGGSSAGTTTGSTIQVGDITWNNATQAGNTTRTFNVTGANGYSLETGDFLLPNLSTRTAGGVWTNVLNPTTASLTIGGNITMASGNNVNGGIPVLELGGTAAGNKVTGSISDAADVGTTNRALSLTKTGVSDWTLDGDNSYTGTTTVTQGSLIINGNSSTATGTVTVAIAGTLGGGGTVGGATTVNGNLRPGTSPGVLAFSDSLTLASTATTTMEINGTGRDTTYDGVDVGTTLAYGGALILDFGTLFGGGNYTFDLFDFTFGNDSDQFSTVSLAGAYAGSLVYDNVDSWELQDGDNTWTFTQSTGDLNLSVIPEPSTALLGALGFLALLRRRR